LNPESRGSDLMNKNYRGIHTDIILRSMLFPKNLRLKKVLPNRDYWMPWKDVFYLRGNWWVNIKD